MSALNYIGLASGDPEFVARWNAGCREDHNNEQRWIAELRANGVKAAHPDDGWVDRENHSFQFAYPQFNDGAEVGSRVVLGWYNSKTRVVRVTRIERSKFFPDLVTYFFEPDRANAWPK